MSGPRHPAPPRGTRWAPLLVAGLSSAGLVGLVLAVDLSMSYRGLTRTRSGEKSDGLHVVDELLGWSPTPGGVGRHRYEGRFDVGYRMDAEGFREVPYRGDPQRQLWLFGDSFTFGQGVAPCASRATRPGASRAWRSRGSGAGSWPSSSTRP